MTDKVVRVVLQLDGKQYQAELKTAEQQHQAWSASVTSAADRAGTAMEGMNARTSKAMAGSSTAGDAAAAAVNRQAAQFTQAAGRMEVSAKQTQMAVRMLPAQFTDIVTSLSSGMPAWQVAIQQGGQIKDSFGGAGLAARALGSYALGLVNPLTLAAAAAGVAGLAYYQGSKEADGYRHAIVMSGNAAGTTVGQLTGMAQAISAVTGTQGAAASALAQMAGSGAVARENLQHFTQVAMGLEQYVGVPVKAVVGDLEQLGRAPLAASIKLNEQYHYLTEAVYSQIKALDEQGRKEEAGAVAQRAYITAMEARKNEIVANLGSIERGWNAVTSAAKKGWDAILGIGRATTDEQNLTQLRENLARLQERNSRPGFKEGQATADLKEEIRLLERKIAMQGANAAAVADQGKQTQALAEWDKIVTANLTKQAKEALEIKNIREKGLAAGKDQAAIEKEIAAYQARNADKGGNGGGKELQTSYRAFITGLNEKLAAQQLELETNRQLSDSDRLRIEWTEALGGRLKGLTDKERQAAEAKLQALAAGEQTKAQQEGELKLAQQIAAARQQEAAGIDAWVKAQQEAAQRTLDGLQDRRQALRDEEEAARLSAAQNISLAEAIELVAIKRLEEAQAAKFHEGSEGWKALQQEIDARKELAALIGGKGAREAAKRTADEASRELQRVTEQYETGLTNAAMQGGKSLREYITGMLRTTGFRILLQPVMGSLAGVLTSVTSAAGGAAGAASNPLGSLGLVSGLMGGGTSAFAMGLSGAWGAGGGLLSTLNAGASLLGSGSIFSGLGVIAGALGPIAMGLSLLSGLIKKSTPHMGALAQYSAAEGLQTGYTHGQFDMGFGGVEANDETRRAVGTVAQTMVTTLDSLSRRFGGTGGYEVATAFADDSSKDGAWGGLRISAGGKDIINWNEDRDGRWAPREFADGEAGRAEYQAELAKSMRTAILEMPLDEWARDQVEALGDDVSLDALSAAVDTINAASEAFDNLALHIESFAALSEDALSDLVKAAGSPQALASGMTSYLNNYYSEEERAAVLRQQISDKLAAQGLEMPTTQEGFRVLVDNAMATLEGSTGDMREEAARAAVELLQLSEAFAAVTDSAEEAAQAQETARRSATDKAYAALQNAVQRERSLAQAALDAAEERASAGRTLVDSLRAEVDDIRGTVDSAAGMAAALGIETVNQALAAVRSGVAPQLLDIDLTGAAAAARGALATGNFRSRTEFEIASLTWANRLEELGDAADKQLTTDEQLVVAAQEQIDGLDALLDQAKMALEVARGTYTGIQDLNTTVKAFYDTVAAEQEDGSAGAGGSGSGASGSGSGGPTWGPGGAGSGNDTKAKYYTPVYLGTAGVGYEAITDPERVAKLDSLAPTFHKYDGTGDLAGLAADIKAQGGTAKDLAALYGFYEADVNAALDRAGIPRFDGGGTHAGGARWVGETAAELEITGPSRILSNRQLGELLRDDSGSASVVTAVQALTTTVYDLLRPLILNSTKTETIMRKFDALGLGVRA